MEISQTFPLSQLFFWSMLGFNIVTLPLWIGDFFKGFGFTEDVMFTSFYH